MDDAYGQDSGLMILTGVHGQFRLSATIGLFNKLPF